MDVLSVRNAYRRYAKIYDVVFGGGFAFGRRAAIERINRRGGRRILEVGVGTGLSLPVHRPDNSIIGIDLSTDMLDVARRRVDRHGLTNVEGLLEMDAEQLAFADSSFDVVVAMFVMTVVPDVSRAMAELERVCSPDGEIYIVNHFAADEPGLRRSVENRMARFSRSLGWRPDFSMDSLMQDSRLEIGEVVTLPPFGLFNLIECRRPGAVSRVRPAVSTQAARLRTAGSS
ncbi:MAG TPA: class I SAM-dependent methyltransferase [Arenibaculum sp.]|nr:class I SAM-dependent methyltransferase [Arenibaculum sp.]